MSNHTDYKILIAEDEESLAMLIDYNLIKNGYKTKIVKDGDFVLSECEIFFPDLILLDWMLPNISGIELCRRLRTQKKYNNVPIIMITALGEESDKIRGLDITIVTSNTSKKGTLELLKEFNFPITEKKVR